MHDPKLRLLLRRGDAHLFGSVCSSLPENDGNEEDDGEKPSCPSKSHQARNWAIVVLVIVIVEHGHPLC